MSAGMYVTLKELTLDLQIFYSEFGLNVQVSGVKLPQWTTFLEFGFSVQVPLGKNTTREAVHFHKALPIIRGMYVTLKELYPPHPNILLRFGLNVQVPGVK